MGKKAWLALGVPLVLGASHFAETGISFGDPSLSGAPPLRVAQAAFDAWRGKPSEPFSGGEAAFHKIMDELRDQYLDDGLTDDQLYHAAARGLLEYVDPARSAWNKLMTPTEYQELTADVSGELVGIGLDYGFEPESGMGVVRRTLPGTPAAGAGLQAGDRILKIDGQSFAGKQQRDMVYAIRGKIGTSVTLTVLRDAKVFDVKLTRAKVDWRDVEVTTIGGDVALLTIHGFSKSTAERVRDGLKSVGAGAGHPGLRALIVDLRGCSGGLFDTAVETAGLFVPEGATVTTVKKRGGDEETLKAQGGPLVADLQTSVLIDGDTASGCELVAAALKQDINATLVGSHTLGKWSIQRVDELENHYAMKFTTAVFLTPDGADPSGKGLVPDVPVAAEPGAAARLQRAPLADRLKEDVQLQTALSLSRLTE